MKTKNLLFSGAIALSTILSPTAALLNSAPVLAANVSVANSNILKDHTFVAYQIFAGKYDAASKSLTSIVWGNGINSEAFLAAIKADSNFVVDGANVFANCKDAADVANALAKLTTVEQKNAFARDAATNKAGNGTELENGKSTDLADGYYVIVDETEFGSGDKDNARNNVLLEVVGDGDIVIELKTDVPTLVKKVKEDDKTGLTYGHLGEKYNDVADYSIGEKVPFGFESAVPDMTNYTSYTYKIHDTMSAGLTLNKDEIVVKIGEETLVKDTDYTVSVTNNSDGTTSFEINILNLKKYAKGQVITVEFTATLNENAVIGLVGNPNEVYLEYSNNPNGTGTGTTTPDEVVVFTYKVNATKVDKNDTTKTLAGAEFKLLKENKEGSEEAKIVDGKFAGWVAAGEGTTLTSDADGTFSITGLDSGTYYLKETKAPTGYSLPSDYFEIVLVATTKNDQNYDGDASKALTSITVNGETGSGNVETGTGSLLVENTSSSSLPETGGTGTAMLYTVGAALVGGAAVFYVTNKRMRKEEE